MSAKIGDAGYRIIGPIASGGMGEVFKAEHVITRRIEAIKVLSGAGTAEECERFLREVQLQASLSHPNIAAVYNAFRVNDDLVMVMELVEGEPLRAILARGVLTVPLALHYANQALRAIAYAHEHGVVHRDITPGNIIITEQGVVKLTDFGLAKAAASPSVSQSGVSLGSPHYMSPEQVKDSTRSSPRSDIYSLGAVLYEMVTGKKVFEGESSFLVMQAQVEQAPVPPIAIAPHVPPALSAAILTSLAKDPQNRFQTADAFRLALEQVLSTPGKPPEQKRGPALHKPPAAPRPGMATVLLSVAAMCAVILPVAMVVDGTRKHAEVKVAAPKSNPQPAPLVEPASSAVQASAAAQPRPAAGKPLPKPAERRQPKVAKRQIPDYTPRIQGEEPPPPVRGLETPGSSAAVPSTDVVPAAPSQLAADSHPQTGTVGSVAPQSPDSPAAVADNADTTTPIEAAQDKKPHGKIRRALGKIFAPFH